uniref:lysoplasmalogenase n=2 Tax=Plectus sambesii TaxID=2011161 RepID=A0A914WBI5_9BILA
MVSLFVLPYAVLIAVFWYLSNGFEKRMHDPKYVWSKTAPVFLLGLLTLFCSRLKKRDRILSGVALLFGAVGDYLIGSSHDGIVPGAVVFGIGHILYLATFVHNMKRVWKPLLFSALLWGLFINYVCFFHKLDTHFRPITVLSIYSIILTTCFVSSGSIWFFSDKNEDNRPALIRFIGYMLFFASDSTLILTHEAYKVAYAEVIILTTYFSSQYLILLGTSLARDTKVRFE